MLFLYSNADLVVSRPNKEDEYVLFDISEYDWIQNRHVNNVFDTFELRKIGTCSNSNKLIKRNWRYLNIISRKRVNRYLLIIMTIMLNERQRQQ